VVRAHANGHRRSCGKHISIFATCDCKAAPISPIPNSVITNTGTRPDVYQLLVRMVFPTIVVEEDADYESKESAERVFSQGGVGVCVSGPESLTLEAANAVARLHMRREWGDPTPYGSVFPVVISCYVHVYCYEIFFVHYGQR
jgi:hypothetical protein